MKHEIRWNCLTSAVLAWMVSCGAVGCMVTAFRPELLSFPRLLLLFGGTAVFASICFALRGGDIVLVGAVALSAGYLWHEGTVWAHIAALLRHISQFYDGAYGWGAVTLGGYNGLGPVDLALGIIGCLGAVSVSWVVMRRKSVLTAMPMTVLPLVSCLVVTDTVPGALWMYLLILGFVLLLLTDYVRRKEKTHVAGLTAYLALPVAAALGLLFFLTPQDSYVNRAGAFEERIIAWAMGFVEPLPEAEEKPREEPGVAISGDSGNSRVDLLDAGPRTAWNYTVLEVTAAESGTYYLRGRDYDTYTGTRWESSGQRLEYFGGGAPTGTLSVRTRGTADMQYLPYYPAEAVFLEGGRLKNGLNLKEYSFEITDAGANADGGNSESYLQLPAETAAWAQPLVLEILAEKPEGTADAQAIADFVRSAARYDLNTPRMSGEEGDFARWFLEESDTGYCVHFATSAAVLLRAGGIPARYVTGYTAHCVSGETVMVPEKAAHAWAEYYDGSAWRVLEATPAHEDNTVPAETEAVTEPSETRAEPAVTEPQPETQPRPMEPAKPEQPEKSPAAAGIPISPWLKAAALAAVLPAAAAGQSLLRRARRRRWWNRGKPNEKALNRWVQVCRLARLLGLTPPQELEELAQKARFSQHTLTERELAAFGFWHQQALRQLRRRPLWQRLYFGIVFAVW